MVFNLQRYISDALRWLVGLVELEVTPGLWSYGFPHYSDWCSLFQTVQDSTLRLRIILHYWRQCCLSRCHSWRCTARKHDSCCLATWPAGFRSSPLSRTTSPHCVHSYLSSWYWGKKCFIELHRKLIYRKKIFNIIHQWSSVQRLTWGNFMNMKSWFCCSCCCTLGLLLSRHGNLTGSWCEDSECVISRIVWTVYAVWLDVFKWYFSCKWLLCSLIILFVDWITNMTYMLISQ